MFDVFAVNHHGYCSAFWLALDGHFARTGDARPVPEALEARGYRVARPLDSFALRYDSWPHLRRVV